MPFAHRHPGRGPPHALGQPSTGRHQTRAAEQPPLGGVQRGARRRERQGAEAGELFGKARLHVVQERRAIGLGQEGRGKRGLLDGMNASVPLPRQPAMQGRRERYVEDDFPQGQPDGHALVTEGIGRPEDPKTGDGHVGAHRVGRRGRRAGPAQPGPGAPVAGRSGFPGPRRTAGEPPPECAGPGGPPRRTDRRDDALRPCRGPTVGPRRREPTAPVDGEGSIQPAPFSLSQYKTTACRTTPRPLPRRSLAAGLKPRGSACPSS